MTRIKNVFTMGVLALAVSGAIASSHREAPQITETPKVDATDFYAFVSTEPNRSDFVTLIANYTPLQDTYGGPNYFSFDPHALYEIHVDNNGDAMEDISFKFRFQNNNKKIELPVKQRDGSVVNTEIPLVLAGTISAGNDSAINLAETFTIEVSRGGRRNQSSSATPQPLKKPLDFVGDKTFGSPQGYEQYARTMIHQVNVPGCSIPAKVFAGQRQDPFYVALGKTFDLLNFSVADITGANGPTGGVDSLEDKSISTIAMEVHKSCLTNGSDPVIGAWTTASLRQSRIIDTKPGDIDQATKDIGPWAQVSRLGMPLVNEVVIGLADKDRFNAAEPVNDTKDPKFGSYVLNPSFPALVELLYGVQAPPAPRNDLLVTFLTGIPGLNKPAGNVTPGEMLRLNTSIAPAAMNQINQLGVIGGDVAGYPNGRRVYDDVVDITVRVAEGVLCTLNGQTTFGCVAADAPGGGIAFTDRVRRPVSSYPNAFPYLATPVSGSSE